MKGMVRELFTEESNAESGETLDQSVRESLEDDPPCPFREYLLFLVHRQSVDVTTHTPRPVRERRQRPCTNKYNIYYIIIFIIRLSA
jgi:hypothetical protein